MPSAHGARWGRTLNEENQKLFSAYRKWQSHDVIFPKGIIVASDMQQEWLLPWWWEHYTRFNSFPVAFIDFGMSKERENGVKSEGR